MALHAKKLKQTGGKTNSAPVLDAGNYLANVVQVIDLGLQARPPWKGQEKSNVYQYWVTYELTSEFMKDEDGEDILDQPRWVSEKINIFDRSQENSTAAKRLDALDPSGALGDDWSQIVGLPCTLTLVNREYKGKTYTNVGGISPPMKGFDVPALINEPKIFDIDDPDMEIYSELPDFLKEMITSNLEFQGSALERALNGEETPPPADDDDDRPY